ncbi:delta(3,5)-Delta(2,4)-dienoyl-CoA isomerase, mitochondrial [Planococcus citri]|uniref:delta(3,5)-Delta(2,4)-dienoyl-CoA isomerase, mitochondrial n=1 Tax=Planococcus citri TaxID=170843 RepID=UPI0031F99931
MVNIGMPGIRSLLTSKFIAVGFCRVSNRAKFSTSQNLMSTPTIPKFETLNVSLPKPWVYHVELNRPEKLNAMSSIMWNEMQQCFEGLNNNADCRVILLSGSGKIFCSGIDLQSFMELGQKFNPADDIARKSKIVYNYIRSFQDSISSLEKCMKPVICAVHNGCIGGAIDLITSADIRNCSKDAWFQIKEVDIGMAADVGTLQRFPKIIGSASLARELIFTGRKFTANEAKEWGLVSQIYDTKETLLENSLNLAENIAKKSPVAVQMAKKSLIYSRDHSVDEGLEHIALINQTMLQSEDLQKAVVASLTKDDSITYSKL